MWQLRRRQLEWAPSHPNQTYVAWRALHVSPQKLFTRFQGCWSVAPLHPRDTRSTDERNEIDALRHFICCGLYTVAALYNLPLLYPFYSHTSNLHKNRTGDLLGMDKSAKQHTTPHQHPQNAPQYKGIRLRKWGKWVSEVRIPKSRAKIWLGSYDTPHQAARAYDAAVFCLRGPKATLNFPGCMPLIPCASSLSRKQIQVAAARYALDQIPSNPNPNSTVLTEKSPSGDNVAMWEEEEEANLWWDSIFMDLDLPSLGSATLDKASENWMEEGCTILDATDIWSWG